MASLTVETWQCDACGKESDIKLQCCGGCKSVYYCDKKCQQRHWNAGHKNECKVMKLQKVDAMINQLCMCFIYGTFSIVFLYGTIFIFVNMCSIVYQLLLIIIMSLSVFYHCIYRSLYVAMCTHSRIYSEVIKMINIILV